MTQLGHCTAWFEMERSHIEGIEDWLGSTLAQPGLKWQRDMARIDPCTVWMEVEVGDIEGIEDWPGSTIAQPSWKWSRKIRKE